MAEELDAPTTHSWQVQDAETHFNDLLRASLESGPQTVTQRGVPLAVLVSVEQWNALRRAPSPTLKDLLLAPSGRTKELVPPRTPHKQRRVSRAR